jgi:hypothetical protein
MRSGLPLEAEQPSRTRSTTLGSLVGKGCWSLYMTDSHWLCMDCGKNTLHTDDYYMLRNKLWLQLVPREQRHEMLCLLCIQPLEAATATRGLPKRR